MALVLGRMRAMDATGVRHRGAYGTGAKGLNSLRIRTCMPDCLHYAVFTITQFSSKIYLPPSLAQHSKQYLKMKNEMYNREVLTQMFKYSKLSQYSDFL